MSFKYIMGIILVLICAGIALSMYQSFFLYSTTASQNGPTIEYTERALLKNTPINISRAITLSQKVRGLSFQKEIKADQGLLFPFSTPGKNAIWMKDMLFPIDVVWLDADLRVVYSKKNFTPDSYPQSEASPTPSQYVLELHDGFVDENHIEIGDELRFLQ